MMEYVNLQVEVANMHNFYFLFIFQENKIFLNFFLYFQNSPILLDFLYYFT